jgi:hypothetical protein
MFRRKEAKEQSNGRSAEQGRIDMEYQPSLLQGIRDFSNLKE